jgi:hypothetical protein
MTTKETAETAFEREAKGPLPDGIKVLSIEFEVWRDEDPWTEKSYNTASIGVDHIEVVLQHVGCSRVLPAFKVGAFDKDTSCVRVGVDIFVTDPVPKWLTGSSYQMPLGLTREFNLGLGRGRTCPGQLRYVRSKLAGSLADVYNAEDLANACGDGWWRFDTEQTTLETGETFAPGDFARWARAVSQETEKSLATFATLADACGGSLDAIYEVLSRQWEEEEQPQTFLVPGLIPRGAVTLMLGDKKVGKSALAMELAVATAQRAEEWIGFPLDKDNLAGFAIYLLGEDSPGTATKRTELMTGGKTPLFLHIIPADGTEIDTILSRLEKQKVALLVVDPARKFYKGDEDSSDAVSEFFTKLETFARTKDCAVVVPHHLKRNAQPKNISEVAVAYRGSSVFLDRPRATLAVIRRNEETHFGIPAPNGVPLHNFLQSTMFSGVRRLRRDEATFRHVPIDVQTPGALATAAPSSKDHLDRIRQAATRLIQIGTRITRTGRAELHAQKPVETDGLSRAKIRRGIDDLLAAGELRLDSGALALAAESSAILTEMPTKMPTEMTLNDLI